MKNVLKFIKTTKIFVVFVILFLIMFALGKITELNAMEILEGITGGTKIYSIHIQIAFFVFAYLIQYFSSDIILYMTKNVACLSTRYKTLDSMYDEFVKKAVFINFVFVLIMLVAAGCNMMFSENIIHVMWYDVTIMIVKIYVKCYLFSLIAFVFLSYLNEEQTFGILSGLVLIVILLKQVFDFNFFDTEVMIQLAVVCGINFVVMLVCTVVFKKIWKGIVKHAG